MYTYINNSIILKCNSASKSSTLKMSVYSFKPDKTKTTEMARLNAPIFSINDFKQMASIAGVQVLYVQINGVIFQAKESNEGEDGKVFINTSQRSQAQITLLDQVQVHPVRIDSANYVDEVLGELKLLKPIRLQEINTDELFKEASTQLRNRPVYINQPYFLFFKEQLIQFTPQQFASSVKNTDNQGSPYRIMTATSQVRFKLAQEFRKSVTLTGGRTEAAVFKDSQLRTMMRTVRRELAEGGGEQPEDDLQLDVRGLGIGGCNVKFADIFRRVFVPRLLPPQFITDYQLQMVRGLILYGPPGTGKTLIARKIGEILNARQPKIVSGPEILNSYVGKSEENIRNLFKDAEADYQRYGDDSELHIIIMDEMDAICKQRGSRGDSTGTHDSIVNQLLAKMDGVEQLNNILVIGMTNRIDMLDEALLRPGRFEVQVQIGLPDRAGRVEILEIHTAVLAKRGALDASVDLQAIADLTPNYSGAELRGVVTAGLSYAQSRLINAQEALQGEKCHDLTVKQAQFKLTMRDLLRALEEVRPAFGRGDGGALERVQHFGFWFYRSSECVLKQLLKQVELLRTGASGNVSAILLNSSRSGSGASSISVEIIKQAKVEFARFISADQLVLKTGTEVGRSDELVRIFRDAYRVPEALIVLDCLEDILMIQQGGVRVGAAVINTVVPLLKRAPTGKLLVIATTNQLMTLDQIGIVSAFQSVINIPALNSEDVQNILSQISSFSTQDETGKEDNNVKTAEQLQDVKQFSDDEIMQLAQAADQQPVRTFFRVLQEEASESKISVNNIIKKITNMSI